MARSGLKVQVCDATGDDSSNTAGYKNNCNCIVNKLFFRNGFDKKFNNQKRLSALVHLWLFACLFVLRCDSNKWRCLYWRVRGCRHFRK